ncbi:MAG: glycosyltransferase family 39 protein [Methanosphaera sp.]|uniref:glycosyltransferase family 39 protein n=2 Tax=Methanosphaera sp. TaxID=2666342 RepID=UPI0025D9D3F0|nr:glycosyltransferase family 39 protein [Methanosphaera sp.]MCI5866532.1 glycosyltransferase family 39 protein [Methanosphaera sp.]MDD6535006.1 glycosyltransferase family 39 protein [Methanosphaera sp.]MDY3955439.1 glycosyltransferase family 39 protein [Methanosphaera sp.]
MTNKYKEFICNNKSNILYVFILLSILLLITIPKLLMQYHVGVANWDSFLYLENGRNFAKMGWGDVPSIAPVFPMMIAKLFLLAGHTYSEAIFNLDALFYIIGVIGVYLILRFKFSNLTSLLGSMIYATFTLLYSWAAIGGNDIIGTTGTILTIYLLLKAAGGNSKFYYLMFPIAAYSFLSRYTAGVMLFAIIFYILVNKLDMAKIKDIIVGAVIGVVSIVWFLNQFNKTLGTPFPFLGQFSGTVSNVKVMDAGFLPDSWYYINHIPNYLASTIPRGATFNALINPMGNIPTILSTLYIILMVAGIAAVFYKIIKTVYTSDIKFATKKNITLTILAAVLFIVCFITICGVSYLMSSIIFMVALLILYYVLRGYDIKYLDYDFMMILLLFVYVVFQSVIYTKNDRYFITALPFIAYFIINAISCIYEFIDSKISLKPKISTIISICAVIFLVVNALSFTQSIPTENQYSDIDDACNWFNENHGNYNNSTIIYSDNWPAVTWYLNLYIQRGVPESDTPDGLAEFSKFMLCENSTHSAASYYIQTTNTDKNMTFPGFSKIYEKGTVAIYQNNYLEDHNQSQFRSSEYRNYTDNLFSNMTEEK